MALNQQQQGVLKGMMLALMLSILTLSLAAFVIPPVIGAALTWPHRLAVLHVGYLLILIPYAVGIIRLAKHRFFSVEDIDAAVGHSQSVKALALQSMLQNTLEQTVLAVITYFVWVLLLPISNLRILYVAALLFFIGRFLFFLFYERGAVARSFGFALTFYPTMLLLLACLVAVVC